MGYVLSMIYIFLCPALAEHTVFVVPVRNGSQLTGVPWDLRLAGHTSATHTFLVGFVLKYVDDMIISYANKLHILML